MDHVQVPVVSLNRQCQYVDEKWIKCGRLARWAMTVQRHRTVFRCDEHATMLSPTKGRASTNHLYYIEGQ